MQAKNGLLIAALAAALLLCASPALAEMEGDVHLLGGQKFMDSEVEPVDQPIYYGVGANFGNVDWPVKIAVDVLLASDSETYRYEYYYSYEYKIDADTTEVDLGVRKFWDANEKVQPYVGGGLAWIDAEVKFRFSADLPLSRVSQFTETFKESDSGIGFWAGAGVLFNVTENFGIGIDARYSDADVEFEESLDSVARQEVTTFKVNGGGTHAGIMLSWRW